MKDTEVYSGKVRRGMRAWVLLGLLAWARPVAAAPSALETAALQVAFDERGALTSVRRPGGPELLGSAQGAAPLRFGVGVPVEGAAPKLLEFGSDRARSVQIEPVTMAADGSRSLRIRFAEFAVDGAPEGLAGLTAWVTASLPANGDSLTLRVGADVPEPLLLEYVQGPALPVAIGAESQLVTGVAKGGVYPALAEWKEGATISASHPGNLAAQFAAAYGAASGVAIQARDAAGYPKGLIAQRKGPALQFSWRHACLTSGRFEPPYDVVVTPLAAPAGGTLTWHHAADVYAAWAHPQPWCAVRYRDRPEIPAWMQAGPSMVRFHRSWLGRPELIGRWLREYWQPLHGKEIPLIVAFWGWEHVDSWVSPTYLPPYPGEDEFRAVVEEVKAANGHAFLWPSGYHWTVSFGVRDDGTFEWDDRSRWEAEGKAHTVVNRDGNLAVSGRPWLRGGQNASLCPGDEWTRNWFDRIGLDCISTGADMVQVDQVVCGNFPTCFSRSHGHAPGPGLWKAEVFAAQMRSLAAKCRAACPDSVVGFEEPQELFNGLAGIQDYRDLEVPWKHVPAPELASVFGYLYHEYLPVFQSNPQGGDLVGQGHCLVTGQIPHLVPSQRIGRGPLLVNGGFEGTGGALTPPGWDKVGSYKGEVWNGASAVETQTVHGGSSSLRLENTAGQTVQVSQNVSIGKGGLTPGKAYRLNVWLRCERLATPNIVNFAAFTSDWQAKAGWRIPFPEADGQWHAASAAFTAPEGTQILRIMIHVSGEARVWVDEMAIVDEATGQTVEVDGAPADHDLTRQWSVLFHGAGRPYLLHGRMLHPPRLESETIAFRGRAVPAILHNAFRAADGSEAVVLCNVTNRERSGTLHWKGQARAVKLGPQEVRLER